MCEHLVQTLWQQRFLVEISPLFLQLHPQTAADIYNLMARHGYRPMIGPLNERQWDELFVVEHI